MKTGPSRVVEDILPLSPLQEGLVFHSVYDEGGADIYTVQLVFDLDGELDPEALREAAAALVRRHGNLRVGFRQRRSGEWVQLVAREVPLDFREVDLTGTPGNRIEAEADRLVAADRERRFDLGRPPLIRFMLLRLAKRRHRFLIAIHHALFDGWSLPILVRELMTLYTTSGDAAGLPAVQPYRDYLTWLAGQDREAAKAAWRTALGGLAQPTRVAGSLPADRVPGLPERIHFELPDGMATALEDRVQAAGVTLNTVVQAAWALTLAKTTGQSDVTFGVTVSGRPAELPGVESMVGLFINTLPLRLRLRPEETLTDLLARIQREQNALLPHQYLGLAEIQQQVGVGDLFDTKMVFENYPIDTDALSAAADAGGLRVTRSQSLDATHYPLALVAMPSPRGLSFRLDYQGDLFDQAFAEETARRLLRVLSQVADDPSTRVGRLRLVSGVDGSGPVRPLDFRSLPELFAARVAVSPGAVAVSSGGVDL
ncbi:condensation domain-containing protein, partial [Micromonospora sp. NPDC048843]|uniref:condensation domain-containing protein n=1 Tax=Micromonospora sp. NPDC048843 TaxID=3155389 RepID=UPI0033DA0596